MYNYLSNAGGNYSVLITMIYPFKKDISIKNFKMRNNEKNIMQVLFFQQISEVIFIFFLLFHIFSTYPEDF